MDRRMRDGYFLPVSFLFLSAKLLNSGRGNFFPLQQLNQFMISQHLQNPSHFSFFTDTSIKLSSIPYSQVQAPNRPLWILRHSTLQAAPPFQRSEFQLCLIPPLSFCVLIISTSFLCFFTLGVVAVPTITTSIPSISTLQFLMQLITHYIKFSLFK